MTVIKCYNSACDHCRECECGAKRIALAVYKRQKTEHGEEVIFTCEPVLDEEDTLHDGECWDDFA